MGKWFFFFALLALSGFAAAPAAGAAELMSTHPSHYRSSGEAVNGGSTSILGRTKQVRAGSRVIVRDEGALLERWVLNTDLSRACNRRLFRQKRDQFLVGIVDGRTYGAAVGGHGSLLDRVKMAENQVVYLFRGQGTTDCRVYHRTK
ncbi:hypothetical protein AAFN88_15105 [Pelagibius sp. CAU 1746]|uniref:hypothetical protein n=1 Tax=Pelagibius sp. CAU 1746 TaxID=3140370 RepID=UPI00325BFF2D